MRTLATNENEQKLVQSHGKIWKPQNPKKEIKPWVRSAFPIKWGSNSTTTKPHCCRRPRQAVRQEQGHGERPTAIFEANCGLSWEFRIIQLQHRKNQHKFCFLPPPPMIWSYRRVREKDTFPLLEQRQLEVESQSICSWGRVRKLPA